MSILSSEMSCLRADAAAAAFDGHGGVRRLAWVEGVAEGSVVATAGGTRPVEAVRVGDEVACAVGGLAAVVRVERRQFDRDALRRDPGYRAVVIAAGAFGAGLPEADVRLAPDQAVAMGGCMAPARLLVNGATIAVDEGTGPVTYVRLMLAGGGGVMAAGLQCRPGGPTWTMRAAVALRGEVDRRALRGAGVLTGMVEAAGTTQVVGWVRDGQRASVAVPIEARIDGEPVAWGFADQRRPDLDMAGMGNCGFALRFPPPSIGTSRWLSVRRASDGAELPGSPVLLATGFSNGPKIGHILGMAVNSATDAAARVDIARSLFATVDRLTAARPPGGIA